MNLVVAIQDELPKIIIRASVLAMQYNAELPHASPTTSLRFIKLFPFLYSLLFTRAVLAPNRATLLHLPPTVRRENSSFGVSRRFRIRSSLCFTSLRLLQSAVKQREERSLVDICCYALCKASLGNRRVVCRHGMKGKGRS